MFLPEHFMQRCFDLALLGNGQVAPNPMVGSVVVHNNRIIGEGFHQFYGKAHAEVNAIANISKEDLKLLPQSTLYVSLEPCCIYGRTPPCTNLILEKKIPKVVISALDKTPGVAGQGVQILKNAGLDVTTGVLKSKGEQLSRIRNTFVTLKRPYIILKFAQTNNHFFGKTENTPFWITNSYSKRLTHKWRKEIDAILVGTQTALIDNPKLTNRLYFGKSPVRILLDKSRRLPQHLHLFNQLQETWVFTQSEEQDSPNLKFIHVPEWDNLLPFSLNHLYEQKKSTLLVEGGAQLLQSFIDHNLWDEARIFTGKAFLPKGIAAPIILSPPAESFHLDSDRLDIYYNRGTA